MTTSPHRRGPGRPRGSRSGQTRPQLVAVASEVFAERGFRGASLADVATRAGLTQAGLLHHFGSKADLLAAVLEHRDDIDAVTLDRLEPRQPGFDTLGTLVDLTQMNIARPEIVRLFATMSGEAVNPDHPAHAWLTRHFDLSRDRFAEQIRAGITAGTIRAEAPVDTIVAILIAVMDGLQIQWLLDPRVDMLAPLRETLDALAARWAIAPASPDTPTRKDAS